MIHSISSLEFTKAMQSNETFVMHYGFEFLIAIKIGNKFFSYGLLSGQHMLFHSQFIAKDYLNTLRRYYNQEEIKSCSQLYSV